MRSRAGVTVAVCAAVLLAGACSTNTVPYDTTPPADAVSEPASEPVEGDSEKREQAWADLCRRDEPGNDTLVAFQGPVETIDPSEPCTERTFGRSAGEKIHVCCDGSWQPL